MSNHKRLFIALSPDQDRRQQLLRCQQALLAQDARLQTARPVPAANLHLTLQFLGQVEANHIDALVTCLARLAQPGFELQLARLGYFAKARILWLGPTAIPAGLLTLVKAVQSAVNTVLPSQAVDVAEYEPHLSLFRSAPEIKFDPLPAAIPWQVERFALFESVSDEDGVRYRALQAFSLRAG